MKTLIALALAIALSGCATPFTITSDGKTVAVKLPLPQK